MSENRTEQATPRRQEKAREKGQIPRSRDLSGALVVLATAACLHWQGAAWPAAWKSYFTALMTHAADSDFSPAALLPGVITQSALWAGPLLALCFVISVGSLALQGGLVLAPAALQPDVNRFNPATNAGHLFSLGGLSRMLKSLLPAAVMLYLMVGVLAREWPTLVNASALGHLANTRFVSALFLEMFWKAGFVLLAWAGCDYLLQRMQHSRQLRMTKQEVREETKETEGNPQVRMRIRRIQRQMRRRRMMKEVERATVVITNPTQFAVALRYVPGETDAPTLLAKGRGAIAQQMRALAVWNSIPVVENPPLARAIYRSVEVGGAIPAKLYSVVAEILAFIFRTQAALRQRVNPGDMEDRNRHA